MNTKKITISFIAITLSLALVQFSLAPLAVAGSPHEQKELPFGIVGTVIDSQSNDISKEPIYTGYFMMRLTDEGDGILGGGIRYFFTTGDDEVTNENGDLTDLGIIGNYKSEKHGLMLQFSGNGFSGQLKEDTRRAPGLLIGFIHTPANGYLSQVFVYGAPCDSEAACIDLMS